MGHIADYGSSRTRLGLYGPPSSPLPPGTVILFVDDQPAIALLGHKMLTLLGYETVVFTCSREALKAFSAAPERFALVVTDLDMPHMNGEALAHQLWDIRAELPVILCTGSSAPTQGRSQLFGFAGLLTKPFGVHEMARTVERALLSHMAPES